MLAADPVGCLAPGFSILWWIDLVLGVTVEDLNATRLLMFQYPLVDRLGFGGLPAAEGADGLGEFQYPLVDRLGFGGCR